MADGSARVHLDTVLNLTRQGVEFAGGHGCAATLFARVEGTWDVASLWARGRFRRPALRWRRQWSQRDHCHQPRTVTRCTRSATNSNCGFDPSERFQQCCSAAPRPGGVMVFLTFGFVSAQSQVATNMFLRQRPMIGTTRQKSKILIPQRYIIAVNARLARLPGCQRLR